MVLQKRIVVLDAGSLEYRFIIKSEDASICGLTTLTCDS